MLNSSTHTGLYRGVLPLMCLASLPFFLSSLSTFFCEIYSFFIFFFFFQAEDGIRDGTVTGVQTCALPISQHRLSSRTHVRTRWYRRNNGKHQQGHPDRQPHKRSRAVEPAQRHPGVQAARSEERRVGKECRSRWSPDHEKKKNNKQQVNSV